MRTRVYIDSYNLYYGCLKGTSYKWLDLVQLFQTHIIPRTPTFNSPKFDDVEIKYFTAPIDGKAALDASSVNDQRSYHAGLRNFCHSNLSIVQGSYSVSETKAFRVEHCQTGKRLDPKDCEKVKVWKLEEKESDVNIAVEAVYDVVMDDSIEQVVFVTNDTDLVPALRKIRAFNQVSKRTDIVIGLVTPTCHSNFERQPNKSLSQLADWNVKYIKEEELGLSQLPCRIPTKRDVVIKPLSWFKFPEQVAEIVKILSAPEAIGNEKRTWRWLSKLSEKPPIVGMPDVSGDLGSLLDSEQGLKDIMLHVKVHIENNAD